MSDEREQRPRLPPRWFVRLALVRAPRSIASPAAASASGVRRATAGAPCDSPSTGRRTGKTRSVILGYFEDGPNIVTLAMNGWADARAVVVAQPATGSRSKSRARRRSAHGHGARRRGRRTVSPVGKVAGDRHEGGRVCGAPVVGDRGRDPRATTHTLSMTERRAFAPPRPGRTPEAGSVDHLVHPHGRARPRPPRTPGSRGRGSFGVNTLSAVLRAASLARICRRDGVRARAAATTAGPGPSGRGSGQRGRGAAARGRRPGR